MNSIYTISGYELSFLSEDSPTTEKIESVVSYCGVEKIQEIYDCLIELDSIEIEKSIIRSGEIITASIKNPFGNIVDLIYNPYCSLKTNFNGIR